MKPTAPVLEVVDRPGCQPLRAGWLLLVLVATPLAGAQSDEPVHFASEIRPILSDQCFECHGPDRAARQAGLRFDLPEGLFAPAESDHVPITPGQPELSELLQRVISDDPDLRMPPPETGAPLKPDQVDRLRRWIQQGANWQQHWSWQPPVRPQLPDVADADWPLGAMDCFVLARLDREQHDPAPVAVQETLLRRVTFDLTGLPPALDELDTFLEDRSPNAYEKQLDRLLASPRLGEHMAWTWLDAARYADTNGYQGDLTRTMWPWRQWVIEAFNANLPFDRFTTEQLAGDLLENPTIDQQIASGFHRNVPLNGEGGRIPEESRVEYVVDRVETTATVWMGLTSSCARCHDHKYDSLSQEEYYRLFAYFNQIDETGSVDSGRMAHPILKVPVRDKVHELRLVERRLADRKATFAAASTDRQPPDRQAWEDQLLDDGQTPPVWSPWQYLGPIQADSVGHGHNKRYGPEETGDASRVYGDTVWQTQDWPDDSIITMPLPPSCVGYAYRQVHVTNPATVELTLGADNGIRLWLNGAPLLNQLTQAGADTEQEKVTLELEPGTHHLLMKITNRTGSGGFYFQSTHGGLPPDIAPILKTAGDQRTPVEQQRLTELYRKSLPEFRDQAQQIRRLEGRRLRLENEAYVKTMVMRRRAEPRETYLLVRGRYDQPDKSEKLLPQVPSALSALPQGAPADRRGLARWLVTADHPLTARVAVNRYWQSLFGIGLVATSEDFGSQGAPPSHPDLLDWLATEYIHLEWDRKALLRKIVTSQTYRQSSRATAEAFRRDPQNRLLGRGPRFRLSAQMLRDQALAFSGLLAERIGGPSVKPYQPVGIWSEFSFGKIRYTPDGGQDLYRRTLYTFWRRSTGPTNVFDNSDRQVCSVRPRRTNTPLQALVLLNDPTYVEAARLLARRILNMADQTSERHLATAFRIATSRWPSQDEQNVLEGCLERARKHFQDQPVAAELLLDVGQARRNPHVDNVELAAYTSVMNVLLNMDETITRE
ncbi:MAG: hypothetical protein CMJ81_09590 [Planctomycetaceae bacterium]|nr:hypothetical protein [Planctomycetaceae bacterium]